MGKGSKSDKRKYARLDLMSKVNFIVIETGGGEAPANRFRAVGKNIGVEGILFTADKELPKGTVIDLEIFLPGRADPVYIEGEVMWCASVKQRGKKKMEYDIGVKFLTMDKNHVLLLIKYVCGELAEDTIGPKGRLARP